MVYAVHEGYLTLVNRFCSILTEARLALTKVQMYSTVLHIDRGKAGTSECTVVYTGLK